MKKQIFNAVGIVGCAIVLMACGTSTSNFRTQSKTSGAVHSEDQQSSQVNYEINVALDTAGMADQAEVENSEEAASLALSKVDMAKLEMKLECPNQSRVISDAKFVLPAGTKDCKIRLVEFRLANGQTFTVETDFPNLDKGSKATFKLGTTSRRAVVTITNQLSPTIVTAASVLFTAADLIDNGNVTAVKDVELASEGSIDVASNLIVNRVSIIGGKKLRVELRCGDADVIGGPKFEEATCSAETLAGHRIAMGKIEKVNEESLRALMTSSAKAMALLAPSFQILPYQASVRRMLVIEMEIDATDRADRVLVIGKLGEKWLRYRTVKIPQ